MSHDRQHQPAPTPAPAQTSQQASATPVAQRGAFGAEPAFVDNRTQAASQRQLVTAIRHSPAMTAQATRIDTLSGSLSAATLQGKALSDNAASQAIPANRQPTIQREGSSWLGTAAGYVGALGGGLYGAAKGAVSGAFSGEGVRSGAYSGMVSGAQLGYQRPGATLGAIAGGAIGHAVGTVGAIGGGVAGFASGLYESGSVTTALGTGAAGAVGGYFSPVLAGAVAGAELGEAANEALAPSLEPSGYADDAVDTESQDTPAINAVRTDNSPADMPLSEFIAGGGTIQAMSVVQRAAPFGGVSTNTYAVPETGKTHTVSYTRIGNGGINFNNPTSVTPAFGISIQENTDKTNILYKHLGTDYIDYKPKGTFAYKWAGNEKARSLHFRAANVKRGYAGAGQPYAGWTWHHQLAPRGEMVPVLTNVHKRHNHNGGVFLW